MPVGRAKFDLNRCNESPLRGEKPDFWPRVKTIPAVFRYAAILPVISNRVSASIALIDIMSARDIKALTEDKETQVQT